MTGTAGYNGKCDRCDLENPRIFVKVYLDRGDGAHREEFWCLNCAQHTTM